MAIIVLVAVVLVYHTRVSPSVPPAPAPHNSGIPVAIDGAVVQAKIADTEALREQGLSGTQPLAQDQGMLFVFDSPGYYSFWMKDMNYPIDMIWIGADKKVVYIQPDAMPASYPETFVSTVPAQYVIEVPDGFAKLHAIKAGDAVVFSL